MKQVDGVWRGSGRLFLFTLALAVSGLTGCRHPEKTMEGAGTLVQAPAEAPTAIPAMPLPYTLNPGDELSLKVRQDPTLDSVVKLDSDGRFQFAYVGSVKAEGLTTNDLRKKIGQGLREYIVDPDVVVNLVSQEQQFVSVLGEAQKPGRVELKPGMRITDVLAEAGGLTEDAAVKEIVLLRRTSEEQVSAGYFNYLEATLRPSTGAWADNIVVQRGDTIVVPRSGRAQWLSVVEFIGANVNLGIDLERAIVLYPDVESVISTGDQVGNSTIIVR